MCLCRTVQVRTNPVVCTVAKYREFILAMKALFIPTEETDVCFNHHNETDVLIDYCQRENLDIYKPSVRHEIGGF